MYYSDDPVRDHERYEAHRERRLNRLPRCSECDEPIQDDTCYEINGELICPACMEENHKKSTDYYID